MRIRTIKPEFWKNEHLARQSELARLLALALLNYADDEGYFNANPVLMRGELFPFHEDSVRLQRAFTELSNIGFVTTYKADDGRCYGRVANFEKHQRISRPTPSKIKPLCKFTEDSLSLHGVLTEDSAPEQGTGNREAEQGTGNMNSASREKSASQVRAESLFKRKATTPWDKAELRAWKDAKATVEATDEEQWTALVAFYAEPETEARPLYRRRNLATLLNNWSGEVAKAQAWFANRSQIAGKW